MRRLRTVTEALPTELGTHDGLAYSLWIPASEGPPAGAVVILHGANSCKESHHDFARALLPAGFASLAFDQRGHGASPGPMDARVIDDIVAMASVLRERAGTDEEALFSQVFEHHHRPVGQRWSAHGTLPLSSAFSPTSC